MSWAIDFYSQQKADGLINFRHRIKLAFIQFMHGAVVKENKKKIIIQVMLYRKGDT